MYDKTEIIKLLPFAGKFDEDKIGFLARIAEIAEAYKGNVISKQYENSHSLYFLLEGHVNFSISVEDKSDEFSVGKSTKKFTPIGWSGFRHPRRYATTVRCEEKSIFIKWSHDNLEKFFEQEPSLGREFIIFILNQSIDLLSHVRGQLAGLNDADWEHEIGSKYRTLNPEENIVIPEANTLFRNSPFFEIAVQRWNKFAVG